MVLSYNDAFEVTWADPAQANESWVHDRLHAPWAQPPLTQALFERIMAVAFGLPTVFVNSYAFMRDFGPPAPPPEVEARGAIPIWKEDFRPHVRLACLELRNRDYEALTAIQLAERLPQYFEEAAEVFRYTTIGIRASMGPAAALINFLEAELGEDGTMLTARLLQGYENHSAAAGIELAELTDLAVASPALADALRSGRYDSIAGVEGGAAFLQRLNDYVSRHGWRADSWYMAHLPTWGEDPALAMAMIARHLNDPSRSPMAGLRRSAAVRDAAIAEAESKLPPDRVGRFRELLQAANEHVAFSEERAAVQLEISGSVRVPVIALGRRLAQEGAIAEPNDIFFLTLERVQAAARHPSPEYRELVDVAKSELRRCERLTPPLYLGVPPSMSKAPPDLQAVMRQIRGYGVIPSEDPRVVNGVGASKGVARGRARILLGLAESSRLQPGDILVCRTTAPPWTPLFAIAAGVVTDAGGLLSHSAICAREYGIPAVVATGNGTVLIPDGAMVSLDGEKGTVTIEA